MNKPQIILTLKQANALYHCLVSEYNDAPIMLKDKEIDKVVLYLNNQVEKIESTLKEEQRKDYERLNKKCWYCTEKGLIKNGICSGCLMRN